MSKAFIFTALSFFSSLADAGSSLNTDNFSLPLECDNKESHVSFDDSKGFTLESAYMMLNVSYLSYLTEKESSEALEKWGFHNYDCIRKNKNKKF